MQFSGFMKLAAAILWTILALNVAAVPYTGQTFTYHQPNGATFSVRLYGDEFFAYEETLDGYVITLDPSSGYYCYARLSKDGYSFESTGVPVDPAAPAPALKSKPGGVAARLRLPSDAVLEKVREKQEEFRVDEKGRPLPAVESPAWPAQSPPEKAIPATTTTGFIKGLCILVDFPDQPGTTPRASVDSMFNQAAGYTGYGNACSVREYFSIQSGGRLDYTNVVTEYVRVSKPKTYYDGNSAMVWGSSKAQELVNDALNVLIAQGFNFAQLSRDASGCIRCINVYYAGTCSSGWSLGLWPHAWAIPERVVNAANGIKAFRYQMTDIRSELQIGTVCHETGHLLCGFPDLYSYNGNPARIDLYSLMAAGAGGDSGKHPTNVDAYLKRAAGWCASVTDIPLNTAGTYTINSKAGNVCRFVNPANPREYFVFEARTSTGYEGPYGGSSLSVAPGVGMAVYHALETGSNTDSTIRMVTKPDGSVATPDCTKPYELLLIEANPSSAVTPWYLNPSPDSIDVFRSDRVNSLSPYRAPELRFWTSSGRLTDSFLDIVNVSAAGNSMTFEVWRRPGSLTVTIEPAAARTAGARWQVDGGAWQTSGATVGSLREGSHTVSFSTVAGWATPSPRNVTISSGQTANMPGTYLQQTPLGDAVDAPEFSWTTGGAANWERRTVASHDGLDAAQSGSISDGQRSSMELTVTGPGTISFWWKVSSERYCDYLAFRVNGLMWDGISGETDWARVTIAISETGLQTLEWRYTKDWGGISGSDCGWVDQVVWRPGVPDTGSLTVVIPQEPLSDDASWRVDGGAWRINALLPVSGLAPGNHTVTFRDLPGWTTPSSQNVTIAAGQMTVVSGTYGSLSLADAVDAPELTWTSDGGRFGELWQRCTGVSHDGTDAAQSGSKLSNDHYSSLLTTVTGPGTVSFWWKVSSERNKDYLKFSVSGLQASAISGEIDWVQAAVGIPSGTQTLEWRYYKDGGYSSGSDCGWVDQVVWRPSAPATGSLKVTITPDSARAAGAQWRVDGGPWQDSATQVSGLPPGQHTVTYKDVQGWVTPAAKSVTVVAGATANAEGTYSSRRDDPGCSLGRKSFGVLGQEVSEETFPVARIAGSAPAVSQGDTIAVRLSAGQPIDETSVWIVVEGDGYYSEDGLWRPVRVLAGNDGWVTHVVGDALPGSILTVTAGAMTLDGREAGPVVARFGVSTPTGRSGQPLFVAEVGDVPPLPDIPAAPCSNVYRIGPEGVFDAPTKVMIPVADGISAHDVDVFYYSESAAHPGWYAGGSVRGWLVPESRVVVKEDGITYLEIEVNHSGVVQLGIPTTNQAAAASANPGALLTLLAMAAVFYVTRRRNQESPIRREALKRP